MNTRALSRGFLTTFAVALCLGGLVLEGCALIEGGLSLHNPRREEPRHGSDFPILRDPLPRVLRYVSSLPGHEGRTCYGLVLSDCAGIPEEVLNLTALEPTLGSTLGRFVEHEGFLLAESLLSDPEIATRHAAHIEWLDSGRLESIVKSPVDISMAELERQEKFVIGLGFNYTEHNAELGGTNPVTAFPKFVEPTGAYEGVSRGSRNDDQPGQLIDYEVELALVLLEDIDLTNPPTDPESFSNSIAFFGANDVTDRVPIILDNRNGFTAGKSHPTYLPAGPWMIHGKHLRPRTRTEGSESLRLTLTITESRPFGGSPATWRQDDYTHSMNRGPLAIIELLGDLCRDVSMPDLRGIPRQLARLEGSRVVLPRGSIILTGTPGGTAIRAPGAGDRFRLFLLGGLSPTGARLAFIEHCERNEEMMGYLHVGDTVESWIQHLGRQRWSVVD